MGVYDMCASKPYCSEHAEMAYVVVFDNVYRFQIDSVCG
jgi:hypothetical protein